MNGQENVVLCAAACVLLCSLLKKKRRKKPRCWVRPLLQRRNEETNKFLEEIKIDPLSGFKNFTRISCQDFELLVNATSPFIAKQDTNYRKCVPVSIRLAITLRYLATGDSFASLMFLFKVSKELIARIVPETCKALISVLKENIKMPNTSEEWMILERQFDHLWNFPHCIGAMDGKHVVIQAPSNTGSDFFNYKGDFSIVLLAQVDANYKFTYVDVGCKGRISDGGVFKNTGFYANLQQGKLNLPEPYPLPGRNNPIPHVIVADDAFALDINLMKPYPGQHDKRSKERIFNYRFSRARRIVENVFGIMSGVFRVLRKPILLAPEKTQLITLTCCYLHNFLITQKSSSQLYTSAGCFDTENQITHCTIDGSWRRDAGMANLLPLRHVGRRPPGDAKNIREEFAHYFQTDIGMVPWQETLA
ncbi:protein ALP1-like [Spodoptera litura]|uniref:Protein ALP1-like n=1 Tax=Spodoptera litura TaxID=69820 RepID=A0A9J7IZE9_SPOLT|nr:protein ALP1-like [Spodoptera litura]XP_022835158.1 protein ALP1-like [Spodoptera litura]